MGNHADDAIAIVPLTHVCRYWRESIISTPENWASISGRDEDMALVSLQRAKAAPLKITYNMRLDRELPSFPSIITPYLQNTRTLAVYLIPSFREFTGMFPDFPQSMPNLQSLELTLSVGANEHTSTDRFESFVPALKRLSLGYIPLYPSLLGLRTLTEFIINDTQFNIHLDTLLDFLEGNHSLESATLEIDFLEPSLRTSQRRTAMKNQLRRLSIESWEVMDIQALVSNIPLQRGSHLQIRLLNGDVRLNDILPDISTAHLSSPQPPTFFELEHQSSFRTILLRGPGGTFSFGKPSTLDEPFEDFSALPLANVREVHLVCSVRSKAIPAVLPAFPLSSFPILETVAVEWRTNVLHILSDLLLNPSSSPTLKTLAFLNCNPFEEIVEGLTKFASERQNWLYRVLIIREDGMFPNAASVRKLGEYVKVVDVRMGDRLPTSLT